MLKLLGIEDRWVTEPGWQPEDGHAHVERMHGMVCEHMAAGTTDEWLAKLRAVGVPCGPLRLKDEVLEDEQVWANDYLVSLEHDLVGRVTTSAPPVKFSATPLAARKASPPLGRHSRALLQEAGLADADIDRLIAAGSVVES
jgi:crotonobetainyl-CoA:carnitine CoA-transferase CaiB-like acyl-CoA transferase